MSGGGVNFTHVSGAVALQFSQHLGIVHHEDRDVLGRYHPPFAIHGMKGDVVVPVVPVKAFGDWGLTVLYTN